MHSTSRSITVFSGWKVCSTSIYVIRKLNQILDEVAKRIHRHRDDVRAYPISHPAEVWLTGQSAVVGPMLQSPSVSINQKKPALAVERQGLWGLVTRLWGKSHDQ